ncbi:MAG TPA: hypothetical protein VGD98_18350 [Ktedonobacteraceae bacterium]
MAEEHVSTKQPLIESEAVSWWSWRPGMRPLRAFLFGGLLSLLALFLLVNGASTLSAGVLDSSSAPLRIPGVVTGHGKDILGSPQLTLHLNESGFPALITLVVSPATSLALTNGSAVLVDYAPHKHIPYALENGKQRYSLPGTSVFENFWQTLGLLLSGLLLLPYPYLLSFWGWRDLHPDQKCQRTATVIATRAARQTTNRTPGLVPRTTHIWYGVALQTEQSATTSPEILTFAVRQELYEELLRGTCVEITYSPHLRYLYALKVLHTTIK